MPRLRRKVNGMNANRVTLHLDNGDSTEMVLQETGVNTVVVDGVRFCPEFVPSLAPVNGSWSRALRFRRMGNGELQAEEVSE